MRTLLIGCFALGACASRLDEGVLSRGPGATPGMNDGGGTAGLGGDGLGPLPAGGGPDAGTLTPSACDPFNPATVGQRPAQWNEARGMWRVAMSDGEAWLKQESPPQAQSPDFVAWTGDPAWRDQRISARVKHSGVNSDDCVIVRYQSPSYYYALCIDQRDAGLTAEWQVVRRTDQGRPTVLASGPVDATRLVHELALRATGPILLATVDGEVKSAVSDTTFPQGAVGLSTEENSAFATVCPEPR